MKCPIVKSGVPRDGRRKRRASFLLTVWATALIFGVIQTCCASIAAPGPYDHETHTFTGAAPVATQDQDHEFGNHNHFLAAHPLDEQNPSGHDRCQGIDAFHNVPVIASATLKSVDDNDPKTPSFATPITNIIFNGYAFAVYRSHYSNVHITSPPVYLTTLRLRL